MGFISGLRRRRRRAADHCQPPPSRALLSPPALAVQLAKLELATLPRFARQTGKWGRLCQARFGRRRRRQGKPTSGSKPRPLIDASINHHAHSSAAARQVCTSKRTSEQQLAVQQRQTGAIRSGPPFVPSRSCLGWPKSRARLERLCFVVCANLAAFWRLEIVS